MFKDENTEHLIKLFYPNQSDLLGYGLKKYTHCRAFAINTMRHGAPLELEL